MKTKQQQTAGELLAKKIHSKIDSSGTDPNRYGGYYSHQDAERLASMKNSDNKSLIPGIEANVSLVERMLMIAAGSYLMYNALSGKNKKVGQGIAAGGMLARGLSGYCPVYDLTSNHGGKLKASNVNIRTSVVIQRPVAEVYEFWRKLENLPKFMKHLESVQQINKITSEWKATGPKGIGSISWKAQILMDEKDKMMSWHSLPESTVDNAGKVLFKDLGNSTELDVTISYRAPLGVAGETAAKWLSPIFENIVKSDIESLKSYLETGQDKIN